ncbi:MAG: glutaredoxin 3 [Parvibaculales bacterium]
MKKVTIYTTQTCPYCHAAKDLLSQKKIAYDEIDVSGNSDLRGQMSQKADGRTSVPQIFFGETHIGGCDDLYELEHQGRLDSLLAD